MTVEILNPETVRDLYRNHGVFACTCYDTPEKHAERVGKSCANDGHMSGSRCEYIKFRITGLDRGTAEQALRHEIGTTVPYEFQDNYSFADYSELIKDVSPDQIVKNMASFRYIDKNGFEWATPEAIRNCPDANERYEWLMNTINGIREDIKQILLDHDVPTSVANEAANFVLPRATTTFVRYRLHSRSTHSLLPQASLHESAGVIRELAHAMKREVALYAPEFARELVPQCEHLLWCPEGERCCGRAPTKQELVSRL